MKNISLKKIQKTIEKNRLQLVEIEKKINKICQIQSNIDKKEKEIEKKISAMNTEIKYIFSFYDEIPFNVKMDFLTSKTIKNYLWNELKNPKTSAFHEEIKPYRGEYKKIKNLYDNIKAEEEKQAKNLLKLYDQKEIIIQYIENLENTLLDELKENELKILELF